MRLVVLCSGQAGQRAGMLDRLLGQADAHGVLAAASGVLGEDVATWWHRLTERDIFANANAQFAIALYQVARWQAVASRLPTPCRVAGYSLGELIAWHVAGALDVAETLRLAALRGRLMDAAAPEGGDNGCLLLWRGRTPTALAAQRDRALAELGLEMAIYRNDEELVIGGPASTVDRFLALPDGFGEHCLRLPVTLPSHTSWLKGAVAPWAEALGNSSLTQARIPVVAGIDASLVQGREQAINALSRQVAQALRWDWIVEDLAGLRADVYLELGPGNDLSKQLQALLPDARSRSAEEFSSAEALVDWVNA
ncbi:malonate decarboxylase subunit epsilon [Denitratisoma sp. agr-D3]